MTTNVHITRINDTLANLSSGLDSHQLAIRSDANNDNVKSLCWHDGTNILEGTARNQKASFTMVTCAGFVCSTATISNILSLSKLTNTYIPRAGAGGQLMNSQILDDGTDVFVSNSLHVGATSGAAGDNNLLVDGDITATGNLTVSTIDVNAIPKAGASNVFTESLITDDGTDVFISKSLHVGATSGTAGDNNLLVDGTITATGNLILSTIDVNAIPKATTSNVITESQITDDATTVSITNNLTVNKRATIKAFVLGNIKIGTATGGTDTLDAALYTGYSWRPTGAGEANLTVTVSNAVEGSIITAHNWDENGGFLLNICDYSVENDCGAYAGTFMYEKSGWSKMAYTNTGRGL